jgi:hypothetical protein
MSTPSQEWRQRGIDRVCLSSQFGLLVLLVEHLVERRELGHLAERHQPHPHLTQRQDVAVQVRQVRPVTPERALDDVLVFSEEADEG